MKRKLPKKLQTFRQVKNKIRPTVKEMKKIKTFDNHKRFTCRYCVLFYNLITYNYNQIYNCYKTAYNVIL